MNSITIFLADFKEYVQVKYLTLYKIGSTI